MKKYLILLFTVLTSLHVSAQSDGSQLWLGKQYANSCQVISQLPDDATAKIAKQELENNWRGKNVELKIDKALNLGEGYNIYAHMQQLDKAVDKINKVDGTETVILSSQQYPRGTKFADAIKHDFKSSCPTTRWCEIMKIK